jgi:hypothetical protein
VILVPSILKQRYDAGKRRRRRCENLDLSIAVTVYGVVHRDLRRNSFRRVGAAARASTPTRSCCEPLLVSHDCGQC